MGKKRSLRILWLEGIAGSIGQLRRMLCLVSLIRLSFLIIAMGWGCLGIGWSLRERRVWGLEERGWNDRSQRMLGGRSQRVMGSLKKMIGTFWRI
jgi:hypothetical protein